MFNSQAAQGVLVRLTGSGSVFGRYRLTFESARATVAGPTSVCLSNSATFTANDLLPGATVSWRTTSSGVLTLPPTVTGPTIRPTATGVGTTTLVATVNDSGCTYEVRQDVLVGPTQLFLTSRGDRCQGGTMEFEVAPVNITANSLVWSVVGQNGTQRVFTTLSPTSISFAMGFRVQDITVTVSGTNACNGQPVQDISSLRVQNCTNATLNFYPNPTAGLMELSIAEEGNSSARSATGNDFSATVHNGQGQPVLTGHSAAGRLLLDMQRLPSGLYQVQAQLNDGRVVRRQLSVQR